MAVKADITIDIDKQIGNLQNLTSIYNARVGDNKTPLTVLWQKNGMALNLKGLHAFIAGKVGDGSYNSETDKVDFPVGTPVVKYEDDGSGTLDDGQSGLTTLRIPKQMWSKNGLFAGYIGLKDDSGAVFTSKDIWFKVLGNVLDAGVAINYFVGDFDKAIAEANGKLNQALEDLKQKYQDKVGSAQNGLDNIQASIQVNQTRQDALTAELKGTQHQIEINNVVTKPDWESKNNQLQAQAAQAVAQYTKSPIPYASLSALQKDKPSGADGAYLTLDNKHIYVWFNGTWNDCGEYPAQGVVSHADKVNKAIDITNNKAPYDDVNTFPLNSTVVVTDTNAVKNLPSSQMQTISTYKNDEVNSVGAVQISIDTKENLFIRYSTQASENYGKWEQINNRAYSVNSNNLEQYNDLNLLSKNSTVQYNVADISLIKNLPKNWNDKGFIVKTLDNPSDDGCIQIIYNQDLQSYWRTTWKYPPAYQEWKPLYSNDTTIKYTVTDKTLTDTYKDLNKLPLNSIVTYAIDTVKENIANLPFELQNNNQGFIVENHNANYQNLVNTDYQKIISQKGDVWIRLAWGSPAVYQEWHMVKTKANFYYAMPSLSMFETMAVLGDSYTTGTTCFNDNWRTSTKIAWPHIIARQNGIALTDSYAKGGITTQNWISDFEPDFLKSKPLDLYVIALGINDANKRYAKDHNYLGALTDINSTSQVDSFYWYYSKIIKDIELVAPNSKIILTSVANNPKNLNSSYTAINGAIQNLAKQYNLPFINTNDDMLFNSDYFFSNMEGGHPVGPVYGAMANSYTKLIEKSIFNNFAYFKNYGATGEITG